MLWVFLLLCFGSAKAQSLDYISVRKRNGQVVKNFYTGSQLLLQRRDGSYLEGPAQAIRNDSVFVLFYDIRYYPTPWGTYQKDTIATLLVGLPFAEVSRLFLSRHKGFFERRTGSLLMAGGAAYLALNITNGVIFGQPLTDPKNLQRVGFAAGAFGLGYLIKKLFVSDGFSRRSQRIEYIHLQAALLKKEKNEEK